ncbi:MAG: ATP-binding cassette domain-containing protein [Pseudomonadota bacterium]|nr:ATP-binding cassette domain-containing protein [Pseudomonadota bacterium]
MNHPAAPFLRVQGLLKTFDGHPAVDRVDLDIAKGEIFALLGPSGCGKSTLLRMLAGFEIPTAGRIVLGGQDLADLPPYRRPMNMMFQSYALFPHLNVWDNIAFGLKRDGMARAPLADRVEAMLKLVHLQSYAQRKPHQLSGGQQQRVALARCLARQPQLLLLDEPLGALDKQLREQTQIELVNIIRAVDVTCVMVTHDQEEAMTMATRIGVMHQGRLLQVDEPAVIYEAPATRFVAEFIGNVNLLEGPPPLALRPEKVSLTRTRPDSNLASDSHCLQATVREASYFGSYTLYHLTLQSGATMKASVANTTTARDAAHRFQRGDVVWAHWSAQSQMALAS